MMAVFDSPVHHAHSIPFLQFARDGPSFHNSSIFQTFKHKARPGSIVRGACLELVSNIPDGSNGSRLGVPSMKPLPYLPYGHPMALAPIDVWFRLLRDAGEPVRWRYWPRLIFALTCSLAATVLTLPERLLFALWIRWHGNERVGNSSKVIPAPLFILGYYRSGTTHLQYLLDRDPNLHSPRWVEALAPQGFILSWALLRLILTPLMPRHRPMDGVAFGPELPAEDDFALNNWALASSLVGRLVLPRARSFFDRFDDPGAVKSAELERWQRCQRDFGYKLSLAAGGRRLLLKSPSHTARVKALLHLYPEAKFIHVSRSPCEVLQSNVAMADIFDRMYHLQDAPPEEQVAAGIALDYRRMEEGYLEARASIPAGQVTELRFQDLLADPLGELRRTYAALGLEYSDAFEQHVLEYLEAVRTYRQNSHKSSDHENVEHLVQELAPLARAFGHERPALPHRGIPLPAASVTPVLAVLTGTLTVVGCAAVWLPLAALANNRLSILIFPAGFAIGLFCRRGARRGVAWLGATAALLTLFLFLGISVATTALLDFTPEAQMPIVDLFHKTALNLRVEARLFWCALGTLSAYKLALRL